MRTLIQGGWVVGYDGRGHELIPHGCVVFEDDRVVHVGSRFDGPVDRRVDATGKLVAPGLINCHLHAATNAGQAVFLDGLKADYFGSNFVGYVAPRRGAAVPRAGDRADVAGTYGLWSALRAGATTIMDVGTMPGGPAAFTRIAGELGVRAYVGPAFRSASYAFDGSRIVWEWDEAAGVAGLERAVAYIKEHDGAYDGRIKAMLYPGQLDTCTPDLLRRARRWADDLGVPMQLHAAMNQREFHHILEQHGQTPIQLLHSIGFLKPGTGLGHCVFHNEHSWCHYPYADDLKLLADSGVTVVHAPYKYAKMGVQFESFERYRALGINIALGTDTYPQDLIHEMRWAALMCRMADGSFRVGRPQDVFDAATLGGARHLGRDDLGRLAPGREGRHHRRRSAPAQLRRRARSHQVAGRVRHRPRRRDNHCRRSGTRGGRPSGARRRAGATARRPGGGRAALEGDPAMALDRQATRRDRAAELPDPRTVTPRVEAATA